MLKYKSPIMSIQLEGFRQETIILNGDNITIIKYLDSQHLTRERNERRQMLPVAVSLG